VSDGDGSGGALHKFIESLVDKSFGFSVEGGSGFVEDEDIGIFDESAGNCDSYLKEREVRISMNEGQKTFSLK